MKRGYRWTAYTGVVLLGCCAGLYLSRATLLPSIAHFLNVSDPPQRVDCLMVLGGSPETRPFVAAACVKAGKATRVLLPTVHRPAEMQDTDSPLDHEVMQRVLLARGVPASAITLLPGECDSTIDEARSLLRYLGSHPDVTVAIVTNDFHTRRARRTFRRVLGERGTEIRFIAAPTDGFDETNWWQCEDGFYCYLTEFTKLVFHELRD